METPVVDLRRTRDLDGVFRDPVLVLFVAGVGNAIVDVPLEALADALDDGVVIVTGIALDQTVVLSFTALATTLLFFDLRVRHAPEAEPDDEAGA